MIKAAIVGASGYAGVELVQILTRHRDVELSHLFVSERSADANFRILDLYGSLTGLCSLPLEPLSLERASALTSEDCDVIFLATEHQVSHDLAPILLDNDIVVVDLSGAFRISDPVLFSKFYGFELGAKQLELLQERVYALVDWCNQEQLQKARLLSMPGCYPTASELAIKPLMASGLLDSSMPPVINAISGVSGAGRKAKLTNSFCEVSLNAYGIFNHRHLIEIEEQVGTKVIFNPHLGNFKRGILATITLKLNAGVTAAQVDQAYSDAYMKCQLKTNGYQGIDALERLDSLVRVRKGVVKLEDVQYKPFCDIAYHIDGEYMVITSAIDNVLKGAASQAVEAMNLHFGLPRARGLF